MHLPTPPPDRRGEVADAAIRVIARDGIDRATVRAVARELGVTTGVISHHFRDKDELMLFVLDRVLEHTRQQLAAAAEGAEGISHAERLERMVLSVLPGADEQNEPEWRVWIAFVGHAIGRPRLLEEHARRYAELREMLRGEIATLQAAGVTPVGLDVDAEVLALIAFVDGLGMAHVVGGEALDERQRGELVRRYLRGAFGDVR